MIDPLNINTTPIKAVGGADCAKGINAPAGLDGKDFKSYLVDSLNEVNNLQKQADVSVEKLATGQTDNVAEVFGAVRKADVAFSLLMEIRNKLIDAYGEIRQMRV